MTLFVSWLVFPLVLLMLSIGCGLLLEQVAGNRLPGVLLTPAGLALILVVASFTTLADATAQLTVPVVIALAVAGLGFSFPWRGRRLDGWAALAAVGALAAYGAPTLLSGQATFAGYISLDDTATWLAMTDRLLEHGRNVAGLAPSSYEATLSGYLGQGSPVGANLPLGVGGKLVGEDIAWLFQPYLAFLGALLALSLYSLLRRLLEPRPLRALAAFVAAQPALLYAYSQWSGMKEMAATALIALLAALVPSVLEHHRQVRNLIPPAVVSAALLTVLTVVGLPWLAPLFGVGIAVVLATRRRPLALSAAAFAVLTAGLSAEPLSHASVFLRHISQGRVLTSAGELGNLDRPLRMIQVFGIWPTGDFRIDPHDLTATHILIAVVAASALLGLWWAWRRRAFELLLYVGTVAVGGLLIVSQGSPWVDGKALAEASPGLVLAGAAGAAALFHRGRRVEAGVVALAIAGGVLWSNVLAYHDVWLAPRSQLGELETIGKRFAGDGPTLMTEYQPYGVRHFLRRMDPEGAGELRRRVVPLRNGQTVPKGGFADIDEIQLDAVLVYRSLVLLRSPAASRPPSPYRLVWSGRFYEVWQRPVLAQSNILEHLSLGTEMEPAAIPSCSEVRRLARLAGPKGRLAAVLRPPATIVNLSQTLHPATWTTWSGNPAWVYPYGPGTLDASVDVSETGRYGVWLGGSFRRRVQLWLDGRSIGTARHQLNHPGQYTPFEAVELSAGSHRLTLRQSNANLLPGSGGTPLPLGPIVVSRTTADLAVTYVPPNDARSLCGKSLDWLEALSA